jgi:hypothetical protein
MNLLEWTVTYIKYKDSFVKRIASIEQNERDQSLLITLKTGKKEKYLCRENLKEISLKELNEDKVTCLNRKSNLDWLIDNWDALKDKKIIFLFANIDKSECWALNTFMHHTVTDKAALKLGLKSLFDSIPEVS